MGGKGSSYSERPLSQEEKDLFSQQTRSLEDATRIAAEQFNLSTEDRDYISRIYRGDLDPNDQRVRDRVAEMMQNMSEPTRPDRNDPAFQTEVSSSSANGQVTIRTEFNQEAYDAALREYEANVTDWEAKKESFTRRAASDLGGDSIDQLLFDAVKASGGRAAAALSTWETEAKRLGGDYINTLGGLSESFKTQLTGASQKMGTADTDIYTQTKAQNLAGISQSYQEALKQAQGALSRRGLAGSGVEAGVIGSIAGQQAMAQSQALAQSYQQAIGLSDQRRQQQMGIAGQVYNLGANTAQQGYGIQSGIMNQFGQAGLNAQQQQLANYQMASGVSQGVFGMSQNYLAQAGQTAGQTASTAGQTGISMGQNAISYNTSQLQAQAAQAQGLGSMVGSGIGAYAAFAAPSDIRLKTNIQPTGNKIGQFNEYTWDWIEGHDYGYNKGVIAQEVLEVIPEAVVLMDNGYYAVNYSMIGA